MTIVRKHKRKLKRGYTKVKQHKRKVRKRTIPYLDADYLTLYHGTQKESIPSIMKEGLKPSLRGKVFLTPSKSTSVLHAEQGPETKYGWAHLRESRVDKTNPAIIQTTIKISKDRKQKLKDLYFGKPDPDPSTIYSIETEGIPSSKIKVIDFDKFKRKTLRRTSEPEKVGEFYTVKSRYGNEANGNS